MRRLQVFGFFWCAAILLHQLYQGRWLIVDTTAPLTFVALYAICRPGSVPRLYALSAVLLATVLWELPRVVNHWMLMGVSSIGMLIALTPALRAQRRGEDVAPFCESILGPIRLQIIVIYVYAVFHKLNTEFFDPELSCAVEHYQRLASILPFVPDEPWTRVPAIVGTLLIEAALPLLLAIRSGVWAALLLGWSFHLGLGLEGFWDFSSVGAAYYAAFVPLWVIVGFDRARAQRGWLNSLCDSAARLGGSRWLFPIAAGLLAVSLAATWALDAGDPLLRYVVNRNAKLLWLALWFVLGGTLLLAIRGGWPPAGDEPTAGAPWWRRPILWIAPAILILNGMSPYIGLKTEHSYAMFSNLRTEGDSWNHYLVPKTVRVLNYADEVVRVVSSTDPLLQHIAQRGYGLVPLELRRRVAMQPGIGITYMRGDRRVRSTPARGDPFLMQPLNFLERKLILFRPTPPPGSNACRH